MDDFEFFVEKAVNEANEKLVHRGSCSSLPDRDMLYYMGVRSTTESALGEASNWYSGSVPCPECMAG